MKHLDARRGHRRMYIGVSLAAMALAVGSGTAFAQTAAPAAAPAKDDSTLVVVTGIRGSLQKAMNVKKNAAGVVDAISAEDIGKFPDTNLAAAVQRVPGVTISRDGFGNASQVTVRGFGPAFNETLIDGRVASTASGNRSFDFSGVGSDFVGELDVLKTPDATLSSGAIGATINIKYPKPLDRPGLHFTVVADENENSKAGKGAPDAGFLISDTFDNDKFGVLFDIATSELKTKTNHVENAGWEGFLLAPSQLAGAAAGASTTGTIPAWFSQQYQLNQQTNDAHRIDGRLVLQYRPNENLLITLNDDYSKDWSSGTSNGYGIWFNSGALQNVQLSPNNTITNFNQAETPTDLDSGTTFTHVENNEIGLNVKWNVNDRFRLDFDYDRAESKNDPDGQIDGISEDIGYGDNGPAGVGLGNNTGIAGVGVGQIPYTTQVGPGPNGNYAQFGNPAIVGSHVVVIGSQRNDDVVNQSKVVGNWDEEHLHVKFGVQYVDEIQTQENVGDFNNGNWQYAAGYGPASGSTNANGVMIPAQFFNGGFSTGNFIPGFSGGGNLPAVIPTYNGMGVFNFEEARAGAAGCDPRVCGPFLMQLVPGSVQKVSEGTLAEFVTFNTDMQLAGRTLTMSLGVRDEETDVKSSGLSQLPTGLSLEPNDHTAFNVAYTPVQAVEDRNKYRYLLPNLDFNYALMDDVKLRLDVSRTLTRAPITDLTPDLNVGAGQRVNALNASGGNPDLLPYLSDNVDVGAEWYYSKNSYASIDLFQKDVTNFVVGGTVVEPINGVMDPTTGSLAQFHVTAQVNGPSATVQGFELAWQHVFGDTGFGYQANATIVDTNKPYDRHNITTSGFAVTGIGNSANFTGFYDKNGFQARVAATWRGSFLQSFGQNQNNSAFGSEPTYVNSALNIDFTSSYDIRKNVTIYVEGTNLTNQTLSTHGRFNDQILDLYDYGSRWLLGVRYHY